MADNKSKINLRPNNSNSRPNNNAGHNSGTPRKLNPNSRPSNPNNRPNNNGGHNGGSQGKPFNSNQNPRPNNPNSRPNNNGSQNGSSPRKPFNPNPNPRPNNPNSRPNNSGGHNGGSQGKSFNPNQNPRPNNPNNRPNNSGGHNEGLQRNPLNSNQSNQFGNLQKKINTNIVSNEQDDNGKVYKKKNGNLKASTSYSLGGTTYKTNGKGEIERWKGKYNKLYPDNKRDNEAQLESGGEDRLSEDNGGHLKACMFGGTSGIENLVPMRETVNKGDYKKGEDEIKKAINNGCEVKDSGEILREDSDSSRPTKIKRNYEWEDKDKKKHNRECIYDNVKGSKDLLKTVKDVIDKDDYKNLSTEIKEAEKDGQEISITSVIKKSEDNQLQSVDIGIRNETEGEKTYRTFSAKQDD